MTSKAIHPSATGVSPLADATRAAITAALERADLAAAIAAVEHLRTQLDLTSGSTRERATGQARLAELWMALREYAAAERCYSLALELTPEDSRYWFNRAAVRRILGALEAAEHDYDRVIALQPRDAQAYLHRSELRVQTSARNHIAELEHVLSADHADWRQEVPLRYALAKECEDLGEFAASWRHLSAGTALRRRHLQYDVREDLATVDWICRAFPSVPTLEEGDPSSGPIFILGMPRTGSTLVDRILGSHSEVHSAGELSDLGATVVTAVYRLLGRVPPRRELVAAAARIEFRALGADYLRRTRAFAGHTRRFTDKLPINYLYCGLIARALPKACMVHVTRDPLANCYAMYKILFDQGYPFSYDLNELADYYLAYRRLMLHWASVLPGRIIDVAYEKLVAEPTVQVPRLLTGLNLPWEAQCLEFHTNAAPVATASAAQVRRPFYQNSVAAWRNFERELAPLARRLRAGGLQIDG
jgi:tetratricopeptide (TPR) repeat protein